MLRYNISGLVLTCRKGNGKQESGQSEHSFSHEDVHWGPGDDACTYRGMEWNGKDWNGREMEQFGEEERKRKTAGSTTEADLGSTG